MTDYRSLAVGAVVGVALGYAIWGSGLHAQSANVVAPRGTYTATASSNRDGVWIMNTTTGQARECLHAGPGDQTVCSPWSP
jgi:hypothetical protein